VKKAQERIKATAMPAVDEIRERADQVTGRLQAFTSQSMQQVRAFVSRSADFVQHRVIAFNQTCRGRKNGNGTQNWSSSTSERNSQNRDSSKDEMKSHWKAHVGENREMEEISFSHETRSETCFSTIFTWILMTATVAKVTNNSF
jgi:hypothetical protein